MAKIIHANPNRAEQESKLFTLQEADKRRRSEYMRKLVKSPSFRRYVLAEILNDELKKAESVEALPTNGTVEQTGQFAIIQIAVTKKLRAIIDRIEAFSVE